jgi:hypothetical protein
MMALMKSQKLYLPVESNKKDILMVGFSFAEKVLRDFEGMLLCRLLYG